MYWLHFNDWGSDKKYTYCVKMSFSAWNCLFSLCHSFTWRKETSWCLKQRSWAFLCECRVFGNSIVGFSKTKCSHRACLSFSGTAAIAPIIAAVKDGKSITYEGREVRHPCILSAYTWWFFLCVDAFPQSACLQGWASLASLKRVMHFV